MKQFEWKYKYYNQLESNTFYQLEINTKFIILQIFKYQIHVNVLQIMTGYYLYDALNLIWTLFLVLIKKQNKVKNKIQNNLIKIVNGILTKAQMLKYHQGLKFEEQGKYYKAIKQFTNAIKIDPQYAIAQVDRGTVYDKLERFEQAIQDYTIAIQIDPQDAWAYINREFAYQQLQKYDKAIKDYTSAIQIDLQDASAYINHGCYQQLEIYDEAIKDYTSAIQIDPQNSITYYNIGFVYTQLQKYEQAIKDLNLIQQKENDPLFHSSLGFVYYTIEQFNKSQEHIKKAQELQNKNLTPLDLKRIREFSFYQQKGQIINQHRFHDFQQQTTIKKEKNLKNVEAGKPKCCQIS